jgi:hypothetical protein
MYEMRRIGSIWKRRQTEELLRAAIVYLESVSGRHDKRSEFPLADHSEHQTVK